MADPVQALGNALSPWIGVKQGSGGMCPSPDAPGMGSSILIPHREGTPWRGQRLCRMLSRHRELPPRCIYWFNLFAIKNASPGMGSMNGAAPSAAPLPWALHQHGTRAHPEVMGCPPPHPDTLEPPATAWILLSLDLPLIWVKTLPIEALCKGNGLKPFLKCQHGTAGHGDGERGINPPRAPNDPEQDPHLDRDGGHGSSQEGAPGLGLLEGPEPPPHCHLPAQQHPWVPSQCRHPSPCPIASPGAAAAQSASEIPRLFQIRNQEERKKPKTPPKNNPKQEEQPQVPARPVPRGATYRLGGPGGAG